MIGTTWSAAIDATLHDASTSACLVVGVLPPGTPPPTAFGELLIHPLGTPVLQLVATPAAGTASFAVPVPATPDLNGVTVHSQGIAIGAGVELANAIDLLLGLL